jgi:hypothetical protein
MNFKGKLWITNKWASIILSILSRLQTFLATPLPWIKENGISHRNNVNVNDPTREERNISKEDESKEYRILELNELSDQMISLANDEVDHSVLEVKVHNEDKEEQINLNKLVKKKRRGMKRI